MAKNVSIVALVVALSCFCSLAYATTKTNLFVEGRVYCDPCRVQFETRLSVPLEGNFISNLLHISPHSYFAISSILFVSI